MERTAVKVGKGWVATASRYADGVGQVKVSCGHSDHVLKREALACAARLKIVVGPARTVQLIGWSGPAGQVSCKDCGGDKFLDAGRSLDYDNWECAGCGTACSTLTETGMSR